MDILSTKTLITFAVVLAIYAILQRIIIKKHKTTEKIGEEYLKIINSEEFKVK